MSEHVLRGDAAAPGLACGPALVIVPVAGSSDPAGDPALELARARAGLEAAADELTALAAGLSPAEAEIVETGALMAHDPALITAIESAIEDGAAAVPALLAATEHHASILAALPDPTLAARAADIRSLGRRAARLTPVSRSEQALNRPGSDPTTLRGQTPRREGVREGDSPLNNRGQPPSHEGDSPVHVKGTAPVVVVAEDLGPADVAEFAASAAAFALSGGGATAHAAIVARSLGVPMVAGAGERLLAVLAGDPVVVDGDRGEVVLAPSRARARVALEQAARRVRTRERAAADRELPSVTTDGRGIRVLANVAAAPEVGVALEAGAEGVGLLRTELQFLDAIAWPTEEEHRAALAPVLAPLAGRTVTVRVLDFGADKTPPFLADRRERGLRLLLSEPAALAAQLRAILAVSRDVDLRVLLPLVERADEVDLVRTMARSLGGAPAIGAMIETPGAADAVTAIAAASDFLSIGTNDLTASTLGVERFAPGAAPAHDPRVLRHVADTTAAAAARGIVVEVCGEAASDPRTLPLLVGLGIDELSAGAACVGAVRRWVRALSAADTADLALRALAAQSADEVERLVTPTADRLRALDAEPAAAHAAP